MTYMRLSLEAIHIRKHCKGSLAPFHLQPPLHLHSISPSVLCFCTALGSFTCTEDGSCIATEMPVHSKKLSSQVAHPSWACLEYEPSMYNVLVERHVAAVYVMIVNCWTSHGRRTLTTSKFSCRVKSNN